MQLHNGTAVVDQDFPRQVITLDFPPGESSIVGKVHIINDNTLESPLEETFTIELVTPVRGTVYPAQGHKRAIVTVTDDDCKKNCSCRYVRILVVL